MKRGHRERRKVKQWYTIYAPENFGEMVVGETPADDPSKLIGRKVELTLEELTGRLIRSSYTKLILQIYKVEGDRAKTKLIGHRTDSDYLRSLARRRISKIDVNVVVTTKDGEKMRVKGSCFTVRRASNAQETLIRKEMESVIEERARSLELHPFMQEILLGKLSSDIYKRVKKIYPVRRIEITKTEIGERQI
ncbi:MAG: 30S ribosomal protein S3ae [Canidatus Methanoxibalbensis ujae]|nr:30S ribosomal protein S3ae [Candidatus Methanoxibalbensis ujae]MCW7077585.1 30S ribosomal protein S3ae [Candidatus Methanoxibalbensis ujae]